jgi:hypothetical protein
VIDPVVFASSFHTWIDVSFEKYITSWWALHRSFKDDPLEMAASWFTRGDLQTQHLLKRSAILMEMLTGADIPLGADCMVVMGGKDPMVHAADVALSLRAQHPEVAVLVDENWVHGGFLWLPDPKGIWGQISSFLLRDDGLVAVGGDEAERRAGESSPVLGSRRRVLAPDGTELPRRVLSQTSMRASMFRVASASKLSRADSGMSVSSSEEEPPLEF